jgi:putative flippase GtrA
MRTLRQLVTFAVIGAVSNAALYGIYLVLSNFGVGPKAAMTAVFVLGVLCTYALNRRWTFRHDDTGRSAVRYAGTYLFAYAMNVAALALLVDVASLPHRTVMLGLIVATAVFIFVLQKLWVFPAKPAARPAQWSR